MHKPGSLGGIRRESAVDTRRDIRDKPPRVGTRPKLLLRTHHVIPRAHILRVYLAAALLAAVAGCTSTSGLLFQSGPHKLLRSAEAFAFKLPHELNTPRETSKQYLPEYRVEPGDVLAVEAADFNSPLRLPSDQTVLPDGSIELGRYGRPVVVGLTISEIQTEVQRLVNRQHPTTDEKSTDAYRVTARMVQPESKVYYVLGEVNSPGAFPLIGRETVLDAIIQAGGIGDRANRHRIILSRPSAPPDCRTVLPICYEKVVQLGDSTTNYQIKPGDRIYVPSLTLSREIMQFLVPSMADKCPNCSDMPTPCLDADGCDSCEPQHPALISRRM